MSLLLLCLGRIRAYHPTQLSKKYREAMDYSSLTFKCLRGGQKIPLFAINNGTCVCCDGSDQFWHHSPVCINSCPSQLTVDEQYEAETLFKKAIDEKKKNVALYHQGYSKLIQNISNLESELNSITSSIKSLEEELESVKPELQMWVYETNGETIPSKEELELQKQYYVNRFDKIPAKEAQIEEEMEEIELLKLPSDDLNENMYERKKKYRIEKWKQLQADAFTKKLNDALIKYVSSSSGIVGKLKNLVKADKGPPIYKRYMTIHNDLASLRAQVLEIRSEIQKNSAFRSMPFGNDGAWFSMMNKKFSTLISDDNSRLSFSLTGGAYATTADGLFIDAGKLVSVDNAIQFEGGVRVEDKNKVSTTVYLFCMPHDVIVEAMRPAVSRYIVRMGTPNACPVQWSDYGFDQFKKDIALYQRDLIRPKEL